MDAHEKEQIEEIKEWWRENRWYILSGLVISIVIVAGWRYWQEYRQEQAQAASLRYEKVLSQAESQDVTALANAVQELQQDYSGTPYAALATLKLAAEYAAAGDYSAALQPLRWAMENTDDDELALVARARLARVMLLNDHGQEAIALLDDVEPGKFAALYAELRGDALLSTGNREAARVAYEAALAAMEPGLGERRLLQMKIDNLAMPLAEIAPPAATTETANAESDDE